MRSAFPRFLTVALGFALLPSVEMCQQVAGATLQVRAGEVKVEVRQQLVEAVVARRSPKVLGVLVQPRTQDGRHRASRRRGHTLAC